MIDPTSYITLADAKQHLNVDAAFTADDSYITQLIKTAIAAVAHDTLRTPEDLMRPSGMDPIAKSAALLMLGTLYAYRESVYNGNISEMPLGYVHLTQQIRHYE